MVRDSPAGGMRSNFCPAAVVITSGGAAEVAPDVLHDAPIPSPTRERPPTRGPTRLWGRGRKDVEATMSGAAAGAGIQTLLQTLARSCEPER